MKDKISELETNKNIIDLYKDINDFKRGTNPEIIV
jgi:hypothetical protein